MPRPTTTKIHPQTVLPGNTIRSKNSKTDEVVRSVSVIVHLANGMDEVYDDTDPITRVEVERVSFPNDLTAG